jgi:DNA-binding beta-propeller fold protein YncE
MPRHLDHARRLTLVVAVSVLPLRVHAAPPPPPPPPIQFLGTFTSPGLCSPRGIALSPSGDVFVGSDCVTNPHVEHFTGAGGLLGMWGLPAGFEGPANGVALDGSGNVFVTDYDGSHMLKFTSSGGLVTSWGSFGSGPGQFNQLVDVATNGSGDVFVLELTGQRIQKFTNGGAYLATIGSAGSGPGQFQNPTGIGLDASGRIYVADAGRLRIMRFSSGGTFETEFSTPAEPYDVAVGPDGNVYVVFIAGSGGQEFSPSGAPIQGFQSSDGLAGGPYRIAISPTGAMFVVEQFLNANRVLRFQIDPHATAAARMTFGRLKAMYR